MGERAIVTPSPPATPPPPSPLPHPPTLLIIPLLPQTPVRSVRMLEFGVFVVPAFRSRSLPAFSMCSDFIHRSFRFYVTRRSLFPVSPREFFSFSLLSFFFLFTLQSLALQPAVHGRYGFLPVREFFQVWSSRSSFPAVEKLPVAKINIVLV